uniref:hypothetical protein n=1 Tax=Klebsiella pneumoniae TaxID=573 RepID=UPI001D0EF888
EQVNDLPLSCGLFPEPPDKVDSVLQPVDVADAHVWDAPWGLLRCVGVVQYIACGRWVQGVSSVLIRKIRRKRTYMFLSFVEKQCAPAEG